jgi:hypothetical protein
MDTRYTMRLAAPLGDEEIPAFAERLADIIKGDPAKLESLLARGTKSLIRATSKEEAEKVATVFRRAGLDVEVVSREEAAAGPAIVPSVEPTSAPPAESAATVSDDSVAAEAHEAPVAVEAPPQVAPTPFDDITVEAAPEVDAASQEAEPPPIAEPLLEPQGDDAAAESSVEPPLVDDAESEHHHLTPESEMVPIEESEAESEPAVQTEDAPPSYSYAEPTGPSAAARLTGLVGALLLIVGPFLGAAAAGIELDLADVGANPFALGMVVLGLVSLLPVLLGRIRWLWLSGLLVAGLWVYALVDSGRSGDLAGLLDQWAWLLFPGGALLMLVAALMPRPR